MNATLESYERWAPSYLAEPHNPLMEAEQQAMCARLPALAGCTVLDLACGTGRYARLAERAGARQVVALDYSPAMLARCAAGGRVRGDMARLPLRTGSFDAVISGLALGHAADLARCAGEIARVLRPGGALLYSDFHPEATRAGLRRAFRDAAGVRHSLPVDGYAIDEHLLALRAAGFSGLELHELRAGIECNARFEGADEFYRAWHGTPLVLVAAARKPFA